ncbi:hypothetical protein D5F01_LYC24556 [Larimichthys crocea]|uniref:Uncharacterized protein n=1 Tax=Larimichthys crocea TaxID=215358 RepID=A0A6G0HE93_LARCR|nr:hypothetical protein D5F01_LYC24556 [Larimichthys crocea]
MAVTARNYIDRAQAETAAEQSRETACIKYERVIALSALSAATLLPEVRHHSVDEPTPSTTWEGGTTPPVTPQHLDGADSTPDSTSEDFNVVPGTHSISTELTLHPTVPRRILQWSPEHRIGVSFPTPLALLVRERIRASDKGAPQKPAPLIPEHRKYIYKPALMTTAAQEITKSARTKKVKINVPTTPYATTKLVHALCSAAKANVWDSEALEQGTRGCEDAPDLLANRHFVRSIACHDSSKTSTIEAAAYSGIMAVNLEKEALVSNAKKPHGQKDASCSLNKLYTDTEALTTAMANFGFKHHYENPHHPEHFHEGEMGDMNLVEAIVDGLACIFERNKTHTDVHSWLSLYYIDRFKGRNKASARKIMEALKLHITGADYKP